MQPIFIQKLKNHKNESKFLVENIVGKIEKAKKKNETIFLVEYQLPSNISDEEKNSDHRIMEAVKDYQNLITIQKKGDSGAEEIIAALESDGTELDHMKICGLNTHACLRSTLMDLIRKVKKEMNYSILADACSTVLGSVYHENSLLEMASWDHVKIKFDKNKKIITVPKDDERLKDAPDLVALGDLYQVGDLIWSAVTPNSMSHSQAEAFCERMHGHLPTKKQVEDLIETMMGEGRKFYTKFNLPLSGDHEFWTSTSAVDKYSGSETFHYYNPGYNYMRFDAPDCHSKFVRCVLQAK